MTTNRLNILRMLVEDRHVSLHALNAPQEAMNGVTPLGFAAWMNSPKAVEILLGASGRAVSVDGKDAYGVTPLMCKSRRFPSLTHTLGSSLDPMNFRRRDP